MRLLFVCTGNLCRSPIAERLTVAWARRDLGRAADSIDVGSAGVAAVAGQPMDRFSLAALEQLGGDPAGFTSRSFSAALAEDADLVLTMTRRQRRAVLEQTPRGLRRTYTLVEAADLVRRIDAEAITSAPLRERAAELAELLHRARAFRETSAADDIADPIGRSRAVHQAVAESIALALRPLADLLLEDPRSPRRRLDAVDGIPVDRKRGAQSSDLYS